MFSYLNWVFMYLVTVKGKKYGSRADLYAVWETSHQPPAATERVECGQTELRCAVSAE